MSSFTKRAALSAQTPNGTEVSANNLLSAFVHSKPKQYSKSSIALQLAELPYGNQYYLDNFGIDKLSYLAFLQADKFSHGICLALETAEYESPTYSPFYP